MALRLNFAGATIHKPGYYGDPRDIHPMTVHYTVIMPTNEDAILTAYALRSFLKILDAPFWTKVLHPHDHPNDTDIRIYFNKTLRHVPQWAR